MRPTLFQKRVCVCTNHLMPPQKFSTTTKRWKSRAMFSSNDLARTSGAIVTELEAITADNVLGNLLSCVNLKFTFRRVVVVAGSRVGVRLGWGRV